MHVASGKFADLVLLFESNVTSRAVREEVEDVYHDIPMDTWKGVYAGQCQHASILKLSCLLS